VVFAEGIYGGGKKKKVSFKMKKSTERWMPDQLCEGGDLHWARNREWTNEGTN